MLRNRGKHAFHPAVQLGASALLALTLCCGLLWLRPRQPEIVVRDEGDRAQVTAALWDPATVKRRVYPMSVVAGGVYSGAEAVAARDLDPTVAAHYRDINLTKLRRTELAGSVHRYVSFRRGNNVYWTRTALRIPEGEAVLEDGASMLRARCGNRLSESPQSPVLPESEPQPTETDFETPMSPESAPPPLVAEAHRRAVASTRTEPLRNWPGSGESSESSEWGGPAVQHASAPPSSGSEGASGRWGGFAGVGGMLLPPSSNPALSGRDNVGVLNPDLFLPLPPQISPHLPAADSLTSESPATSVVVFLQAPPTAQTRTELSPNTPAPPPPGTTFVRTPTPTPVPVLLVSSPGLPLAEPKPSGSVSSSSLTQPQPGGATPGSTTPVAVFVPGGPVPGGSLTPEESIPEPGTVHLFLAGLAGVALWRIRRRS